MGNESRGAWAYAKEPGLTRESVVRYADRLQRAGINELFMNVKGGDGLLYWPSKAFPQTVAPGYAEFDFPAELLDACSARGIRLHAWFMDYFEGGIATQLHPEWTARDPQNHEIKDEILRGKPFGGNWMCPAQRPGYTDQWLIPLYREFAERYAFESLHHDFVRYPGDVAPDRYCFCDSCLEKMAQFNGFVSEVYPDEPFYHAHYDRPYLEAHWEQSPRVLPRNWDKLDRESKARFYLEGGFFQGGRNDLDTFFYQYRTHWIDRFVIESAQAVRAARPGMQLSGAIFKNPVHSGRFIGQDWRNFAPHMEIAVPMDYRDHFPGTFENYLRLLEEAVGRQKVWAQDFEKLWIGVACWPLCQAGEEANFTDRLTETVRCLQALKVEGIVLFCTDDFEKYGLWDTVGKLFGG